MNPSDNVLDATTLFSSWLLSRQLVLNSTAFLTLGQITLLTFFSLTYCLLLIIIGLNQLSSAPYSPCLFIIAVLLLRAHFLCNNVSEICSTNRESFLSMLPSDVPSVVVSAIAKNLFGVWLVHKFLLLLCMQISKSRNTIFSPKSSRTQFRFYTWLRHLFFSTFFQIMSMPSMNLTKTKAFLLGFL